jgi:LuxR family transcriptional regulator, maltose regulon positive regulatory protein
MAANLFTVVGPPMNDTDSAIPSHVRSGQAALERGDWEEARDSFDAALLEDPGEARAWEGLATASLWLSDLGRVVECRERAYAAYRDRGDEVAAARIALDLAGSHLELRSEPAVANGWIQHARRLLDPLPASASHALLHIYDAFFALEGDLDPDAAAGHAQQAVAVSEAVGDRDTGMLGLALLGQARVSAGVVHEGMSLLDEAVAIALSGDSRDPDYICRACCCMIDACELVRDYGRAIEWCDRLREVAARWRVESFLALCRLKYSGVLIWRGAWEEAEAELIASQNQLTTTRPAAVTAPLARLAELRRRQGRVQEAESLLAAAGTHPSAMPVRAALALDTGDPATAADLAAALLRRIPKRAMTERVQALELLARAELLRGAVEAAGAAAGELEDIAGSIGTDPVRAVSLAASGAVALARDDAEWARKCFEDAAYLFERSGSPYECARVRLDLARALLALDQRPQARTETMAALSALESMGAAPEAGRARALLQEAPSAPRRSLLTRRQMEVLALAAEGLTDREIGERLFISEYTVHRHISDILVRLGASSRTGAVAQAFREGYL